MQQDLAVFAGQGLDIVTDDLLGRVIQNVTLGVIERWEIIVGVPVREVVLARVNDVDHDKGNTDPAVIRSFRGVNRVTEMEDFSVGGGVQRLHENSCIIFGKGSFIKLLEGGCHFHTGQTVHRQGCILFTIWSDTRYANRVGVVAVHLHENV